MADDTRGNRQTGTLMICVTLIVIAIIAGIVSISLGQSDGGRAATVITILAGLCATALTGLLALARTDVINDKVTEVNSKADRALNGEMDKKIAAATRRTLIEVLDERLEDTPTPKPRK